MNHPLHLAVAKEIQKSIKGEAELLRDPACGGAQHLPLFVGPDRGLDKRICDVDGLIVSGGKVRVILEIEESGFHPTKICGKFLQSAIATHFIHDLQQEKVTPYGDRVLFVQVLDGSKVLKEGTKKDAQGELIEQKIRNLLPLKDSGITDYKLFFVRGVDDVAGLETVGVAVAAALQ
jgi:hypothetical protein